MSEHIVYAEEGVEGRVSIIEPSCVKERSMKSMRVKGNISALKQKMSLEKFLVGLVVMLVILLITFIILYATKEERNNTTKQEYEYCTDRKCVVIASRLIEAMNRSINPCDNFYNYACGGWLHKTKIPAYDKKIGIVGELIDKNELVMKHIIDDLVLNKIHASSKPLRQAVKLYKSCIDIRQIERIGDKRMKEYIKKLGSWPVSDPHFQGSNWKLMDSLVLVNFATKKGSFYNLHASPDPSGPPDLYMLFIDAPKFIMGPGMDKTSYISNKTRHVNKRKAYMNLMKAIVTRMGSNQTGLKLMDDVFKFETLLATIAGREAKTHDIMTIGEFMNKTEIPKKWLEELVTTTAFLEAIGRLTNITTIPREWLIELGRGSSDVLLEKIRKVKIVSRRTGYLKDAYQHFSRLPREVQSSYLVWRAVLTIITTMDSTPLYKSIFYDYNGKMVLPEPRWRYCVRYITKTLGYALTKHFVDRAFDETAEKMVMELVEAIKEEFEKSIETMHWIDDKTREYAKRKASMIKDNIAYPGLIFNNTKLEDKYADLKVLKDDFFLNAVEIVKYKKMKNYLLLGQSTDKPVWIIQPAMVNAVNYRIRNEITIPAGILQWPFYDRRYPRAMSYGATGMLVGHEIFHAFDSHGIHFDIDGYVLPWMTQHSLQEFQNRAQCFVNQYSMFSMFGQNPNGRKTLAEDISDNAGIRQAFQAYRSWVKQNGREKKLVGLDLNPEQLFFLSFAQTWCTKFQKSAAIHRLETDKHSLAPFRVMGSLQNFDDFSEVYNCPVGSTMNPKSKCKIW